MIYDPVVHLPVGGELSDELAAAVAEGQPILLTAAGRPAAVLIDCDSWAEVQMAADDGWPGAGQDQPVLDDSSAL